MLRHTRWQVMASILLPRVLVADDGTVRELSDNGAASDAMLGPEGGHCGLHVSAELVSVLQADKQGLDVNSFRTN